MLLNEDSITPTDRDKRARSAKVPGVISTRFRSTTYQPVGRSIPDGAASGTS